MSGNFIIVAHFPGQEKYGKFALPGKIMFALLQSSGKVAFWGLTET